MVDKWIRRFLILASIHASFSKDPSRKIGCVIANKNKLIISTGYNGLPSWVNDDCLCNMDKDLKCNLVTHAEINAIENVPVDCYSEELYMFVTGVPCYICANKIKHSKLNIKKIYYSYMGSETYRIRHRIQESLDTLTNSGIEVEYYNLGDECEEAIHKFIQNTGL